MDHCHLAGQVFNLVALQAADEMPFGSRFDFIDFGDTLLDIAFTEQGLSGGNCSLNIRRRFFLRHCNQTDVLRVAVAFYTCGSDLLTDLRNVVGNIHSNYLAKSSIAAISSSAAMTSQSGRPTTLV